MKRMYEVDESNKGEGLKLFIGFLKLGLIGVGILAFIGGMIYLTYTGYLPTRYHYLNNGNVKVSK